MIKISKLNDVYYNKFKSTGRFRQIYVVFSEYMSFKMPNMFVIESVWKKVIFKTVKKCFIISHNWKTEKVIPYFGYAGEGTVKNRSKKDFDL